jgi:NADH dehydrogenase
MPIFGSGENLVQPVYVADVAAATAGVLLRAGTVGKTYTLAGPEPMAYGDMIDTLAELAKLTVIKVHVPLVVALPLVRWGERIISGFPVQSDQVQRMGEDRSFDISAAQKELGFVPRSFEEGIREAMSNEQ